MTSEYFYPLDLTGTQPSNLIANEKHTVSPPSEITQASFIVLRACPFFADNIVVKDGIGSTARTLVFGEDYILTHKSIALTMLTKKPVYASIMFKDRNYTGSVYVTYNTVGGEYNLDDYTIVEKLTRQKYILTHVSFDQIAGLPASYPNPPHQHDPTDMVGMGGVVSALTNIGADIRSTQGSYGTLDAIVNGHLNNVAAHSPAQVGLGFVKNFDTASPIDFENRAADKYTTAVGVADYVNAELYRVDQEHAAAYITKTVADLTYVRAEDIYTKQESDNLYHSKDYLDLTFLKKTDAVTTEQVGNIVNTIVDMSQYHTRTEALGTFYSRGDADDRFYTRTQIDNTFVTQSNADRRYIQTTEPSAIISPYDDNRLTIEDNKFYVGLNAPETVFNLYIDCINGSDNSPGTRSEPLRTLSQANAMTPPNKSSTWHLRHYTIDQMESANFWYTWDFNARIKDGATRTISIYGNTWIDGAKFSEARQLNDGSITWWNISQITRVPIYIRSFNNAAGKPELYGVELFDQSKIDVKCVMFIKPVPIDEQGFEASKKSESAFFSGTGEVTLKGSWLMQVGDYGIVDTTYFKWFVSRPTKEIKLVFERCLYGYVTEFIETGVTQYKVDSSTIFNYVDSGNRPFQYHYTIGSIVVSPGNGVGTGAAAAGATETNENMFSVLQRTGMFRGLKIVNNVCVNIQTNLALVD